MTPWQPSTCPRWRPTKYARIRQLVQISQSTSFLRSTAFYSSKTVFAPHLIYTLLRNLPVTPLVLLSRLFPAFHSFLLCLFSHGR